MTYPIRFTIDGGQPAISFSVEVAEDLSTAVNTLTAASLPQQLPVRLGTFAGMLDATAAEALLDWAGQVPVLEPGAQLAPGTVLRLLSVAGGPDRIVRPDAVDDQIEQQLAASSTAALDSPVCAVEFAAVGDVLRIRGLGTRAFPLLLLDPAVAGYWAKIWRDEASGERRYLERSALDDVTQGVLDLAPDDTITVPLPPGSAPAGGFACWRAGPGPQRAILAGTWAL